MNGQIAAEEMFEINDPTTQTLILVSWIQKWNTIWWMNSNYWIHFLHEFQGSLLLI